MSEPDGGRAFPGGTAHYVNSQGMTLRDYFASQAIMTAALNDPDTTRPGQGVNIPALAQCAYAIADAMLAERTKGR